MIILTGLVDGSLCKLDNSTFFVMMVSFSTLYLFYVYSFTQILFKNILQFNSLKTWVSVFRLFIFYTLPRMNSLSLLTVC